MKATMLGRERMTLHLKWTLSQMNSNKPINKAYKATKHQFVIDGFRKGKRRESLLR